MRAFCVVSLAALLAGCAHTPMPQVNRAAKSDKLVVKKAEQPTPNQVVKKRWQWPDWLHK